MALMGSLAIVLLTLGISQWMASPAKRYGLESVGQLECAVLSEGGDRDSLAWKRCSIPHNWDRVLPGYQGDVLYRMILTSSSGMPPPGILLAASMNAAIRLNGQWLGNGGPMREPMSRNWNHHLFFPLSAGQMKQGDNLVEILVRGYANNSSGLLRVYTGPLNSVRAAFREFQVRGSFVGMAAWVATGVVGLLALFASLLLRSRMVACFALGCMTSMVYLADVVLVDVEIPRAIWERAVQFSIVASQGFFMLFIARLLDLKMPRLEMIVSVYLLMGLVLLILVPDSRLMPAAALWEGISLLMVLAADLLAFIYWISRGEGLYLAVALGLLASLATCLHDWIPWVAGNGVAQPFIFYLGPVGFMVAMAALLVSTLVSEAEREREMARTLQGVVERNEKGLQRINRSMLDLWKDQAVRDERDRIVRELHDGLGGRLAAAAIDSSHDPALQKEIREAMDELRFIMGAIDSDLDPGSLLVACRSRMERLAECSGIQLEWQVEGLPRCMEFGEQAMHVIRIIQEGVTNAMRHSQAGRVQVRLDENTLIIADDGAGFDEKTVEKGRGLHNLHYRAQRTGGIFDLRSDSSGTMIRISWP